MYYSTTTTNENHVDSPTPYLCLKSRLWQSVFGKRVLALVVFFLFLNSWEIFLRDYLQEATTQCSLTRVQNNTTISDAISREINPKVIQNQVKAVIDDVWYSTNTMVAFLENGTDATLVNQISNINCTIESALEVALNITSSYKPQNYSKEFAEVRKNVSSTLDSSSEEIASSLKLQNQSISSMAAKLKQRAISIGTQLDFSKLALNYTWITTSFDSIESVFENETSYLEKVVDKNNKNYNNSSIIKELQKLSDQRFTVFKAFSKAENNFDKFLKDFKSRLYNLTDTSIYVNSLITNTSNVAKSRNQTVSTSKAEDDISSVFNDIILKHRITFLVLLVMFLLLQIIHQWLQFQFEQHQSKKLSHEVEVTGNHLAVIHHSLNPIANAVAQAIIKAVSEIQYSRQKYFAEQNQVFIYWFASWMASNKSNIGTLLFLSGLLLVLYMYFGELENALSAGTGIYCASPVDNGSANVLLTKDSAFEKDEIVEAIQLIVANLTALLKKQLANQKQSFTNLIRENYPSEYSPVLITDDISNTTYKSLIDYVEMFGKLQLSRTNYSINNIPSFPETSLNKGQYLSSTDSTPLFGVINKSLESTKNTIGFVAVAAWAIVGIYTLAGLIYTIYKCHKNKN